jgi:hypothetical protein
LAHGAARLVTANSPPDEVELGSNLKVTVESVHEPDTGGGSVAEPCVKWASIRS